MRSCSLLNITGSFWNQIAALCILSSLFLFLPTYTYTQELEELNLEEELGDIDLNMDILGIDVDMGEESDALAQLYESGMDTVDVVDLIRSILQDDGRFYTIADMYSVQTGDVRSLLISNKYISYKSITLEDEFDLGLDMEKSIIEYFFTPHFFKEIDSVKYLYIKDMVTFQDCIF